MCSLKKGISITKCYKLPLFSIFDNVCSGFFSVYGLFCLQFPGCLPVFALLTGGGFFNQTQNIVGEIRRPLYLSTPVKVNAEIEQRQPNTGIPISSLFIVSCVNVTLYVSAFLVTQTAYISINFEYFCLIGEENNGFFSFNQIWQFDLLATTRQMLNIFNIFKILCLIVPMTGTVCVYWVNDRYQFKAYLLQPFTGNGDSLLK